MVQELKCPKCGSTNIEEDDCFDTTYGGIDCNVEYWCGCCNNCHAELQWKRYYGFIGYDEIKED